jgi:4-amino-4-deoxy-L-arabinose transferase-like glycosyltransferase
VSTTATAEHRPGPEPDPLRTALIEIVIPVHNEERELAGCVQVLHTYLREHIPFPATITIADNASTDGQSIMVDKPPASLWVTELAVRIFGLNPWSVLVPQALEGVAAVGVLFAAVRRSHGPAAGLLAGAVLALTPVAVLMFRFNNPDALLVLLLILGAYALVRALEAGRTGWLVAAAVFIGFGFLTKMMQAFLVVPGFALTYLLAAPVALRRRIGQLLAAGVALVVSSGWWVAIVELWPAADRPYVGGSQTNSVLELIFGYNGFGRLTGNEIGSVGRGGLAGGPRGPAGGRNGGGGVRQLFDWSMGSQIAWLLPAALLFLLTLLWVGRRQPRTDRLRASMLLWGGWLLVTGAVLSYAQGIIHPYYTVALAPAIGALVGIGAVTLWQLRSRLLARAVLSAGLAGTAVWAFLLLDRAIHYFIGGGGFPGQRGGSSSSRQIAGWVQQNFTATTVGGSEVYDLAVR